MRKILKHPYYYFAFGSKISPQTISRFREFLKAVSSSVLLAVVIHLKPCPGSEKFLKWWWWD
jgi:hypothetical protein